MNEPRLISCPRCAKDRLNAYMGSITASGDFVILRGSYRDRQLGGKHYKPYSNLLIMSETYSVICDCGYYIRIEYGKMIPEPLQDKIING